MNQLVNAKIHNRFDIEVIDARTGEVRQKAFAENIMLDQSWEQIIQQRMYDVKWFSGIAFGTGTGTLSASRTALFDALGQRETNEHVFSYNGSDAYSVKRKITLLETEYNGEELTEVGIWDMLSEKLMTHALLKDMNGNTVSILKVDTDILYIYATTYLKITNTPAKDAPIDFYRCEGQYNALVAGLLGCRISIDPSMGGNDSLGCNTFPSYIHYAYGNHECFKPYMDYGAGDTVYTQELSVTLDVGNKKATMYLRVPASEMNLETGIKTFMMNCFRNGYVRTMPGLVGHFPSTFHTQSQIIEQIGTGDGETTDFTTAFPFVKSGAVIKVDGSVVSPTVITGVPHQKDIAQYMYNLGKGDGFKSKSASLSAYPASDPEIMQNPFYASRGIDTILCSYVTLYTSSDGETWTQVYTTTGAEQTYTVDSAHRQKQYWKAVKSGEQQWRILSMNCNALDNLKNVQFSTAPAAGAVVTAEYYSDVAAKDVYHVLDITVVVQLGEYTP